jgi:hypothetical protein
MAEWLVETMAAGGVAGVISHFVTSAVRSGISAWKARREIQIADKKQVDEARIAKEMMYSSREKDLFERQETIIKGFEARLLMATERGDIERQQCADERRKCSEDIQRLEHEIAKCHDEHINSQNDRAVLRTELIEARAQLQHLKGSVEANMTDSAKRMENLEKKLTNGGNGGGH